MTNKEAYEKINHTLCLNSMNLNFSIDDVEHLDCTNPEEMIECLEIIEKDLKRLEEIDNAKPSGALEGVNALYANALDLTTENTKYLPKFLKPIRDKIKQSLIQAEKEHNALEIIKEKNVDMFELRACSSSKSYNNCISFKIGFIKNYELTEEEFNLVKGEVENDK